MIKGENKLLVWEETYESPTVLASADGDVLPPDGVGVDLTVFGYGENLPTTSGTTHRVAALYAPAQYGVHEATWKLTQGVGATLQTVWRREVYYVSQGNLYGHVNKILDLSLSESIVDRLLADALPELLDLFPCITDDGATLDDLSYADLQALETGLAYYTALAMYGSPATKRGNVVKVRISTIMEKTFQIPSADEQTLSNWRGRYQNAMSRISCVAAAQADEDVQNPGRLFAEGNLRNNVDADSPWGRLFS